MENIPHHIALIPDGSRRWVRKKNLPLWRGYQAATPVLEKILIKAQELKIPYFTFWGSSWDNLTKRSKVEINFLFKLYTEQFKKIEKDKRIHRNKVKINILGRWREILPKETKKAIEKVMEVTKNYGQYFLTFLLAYDGRDEMLNCIRKILTYNQPIKITKKLIKENLWTKDLPPVDLVIRTGCEGDPHYSAGFMMWHTAYSQLYFTKTFFPAFSLKEFEQIIKNYSKRERRLGT